MSPGLPVCCWREVLSKAKVLHGRCARAGRSRRNNPIEQTSVRALETEGQGTGLLNREVNMRIISVIIAVAFAAVIGCSQSTDDLATPVVADGTTYPNGLTAEEFARVEQWNAYLFTTLVPPIIEKVKEQIAAAVIDDSTLLYGGYYDNVGQYIPQQTINLSNLQEITDTQTLLAREAVARGDIEDDLQTDRVNLLNRLESDIDTILAKLTEPPVTILREPTPEEFDRTFCDELWRRIFESIPVEGNYIGIVTGPRLGVGVGC